MVDCSLCGAATPVLVSGVPICDACCSQSTLDHERILRVLRTKVESARRQRELANDRFGQIIEAVPSQTPAPGGGFRLAQAGREYRDSIRAMDRAIHNLCEFILKGIVPDDVKLRKEGALETRNPPKQALA